MIDILDILAATADGDVYKLNVAKVLAQVINFAIVSFILYRFGFKPVVATMDERQRKIQEGLDYAEEMKKTLAESEKRQAEILREAQQKSQEIIDEARVTAKAIVEKQTQEANQRAEATLKKAAETIEQERAAMLAEVRQEIASLVVVTTEKVLRRDLTSADRSSITESAARELSQLN